MKVVVHGVEFEIDETATGPAIFMLGVRKSGSSMFNRIAMMLSRMNGRNYVDVAGKFFDHNVKTTVWLGDNEVRRLLHLGNVYAGFREYPENITSTPMYKRGKKIFLYRDPRDALVSEYFSTAYSHRLPQESEADGGVRATILMQREKAKNTEITAYVTQRARHMRTTILPFIEVLRDENAACFKYEDIIFDKPKFVADICAHLGWSCKPGQLANILDKTDIRPDTENPTQFIRRVTPGDHREKLDQPTIDRINTELGDILETMGYPA